MKIAVEKYLVPLAGALKPYHVSAEYSNGKLVFKKNSDRVEMSVADEAYDYSDHVHEYILPLDYLVRVPLKVAGLILSKLHANKVVFARKCVIKRIENSEARSFLDAYHFLNSTTAAFSYGLFYNEELLAVASFSKGRKMNRLAPEKRSFELIRFCCKPGITVAGGLTKLVNNFCKERSAGDIMTYIDRQFSNGRAFISAGFVKHSETPPVYFLVNRKTFERIPSDGNEYDRSEFYLTRNAGNIKMVYTPHD